MSLLQAFVRTGGIVSRVSMPRIRMSIMLNDERMKEAMSNSVSGKSWLKCRPMGIGAAAGQTVVPNQAFEKLVDTNDAWISKRTGIRRRHLLSEGVGLRDLAATSALEALKNSKVDAKDIDLVIVATSSPDDLFGDAASVASAVGATKAAAFDITAACSGFVFGLVTASQFIQSQTYKKVLLVGADALSRFLDWNDRGTSILFGDGAGAMVLEATSSEQESGLLGFALHSNGDGYSNLKVAFESKFVEMGNEEKTKIDKGSYQKLTMNGPEVYKFAVREVLYCLVIVYNRINVWIIGSFGCERSYRKCWIDYCGC